MKNHAIAVYLPGDKDWGYLQGSFVEVYKETLGWKFKFFLDNPKDLRALADYIEAQEKDNP